MNAPAIRFFKDPVGNNVAYAEHGEGPLVICPAWWISHVEKDWARESFRDFFSRLGRGVRIVRYDRPGVGLSDYVGGPRSLESETALLSALADELGEKTFSFFAMSCAGPPALAYAAANPGKVDKICLYGTYTCGAELGPKDVREAVLTTVRAHWGMGSRAMADIFLPEEPRDVLNEFAAQQRDAADMETAHQLLQLTYDMDATSYLADVAAECLIVHRRGDRAVPHEAGRTLTAALKNARLVTLEGRAHPPWVRGGSDVADVANAFFLDNKPAEKAAVERPVDACRLDRSNRRLVVSGKNIALTPLEFAVMQELTDATDEVVTRDYLLEKVWKQPFEGSNRIDSLMRGLRRKLGAYAPSIETVIGHGYKFIGWTKRD